MPVLDTVLEGAALVARQATSALAATSAAATTGISAPAASGAPSTTLFPEPSTTVSSPSTTTTSSGSKSPGGSSPLLFFVALGFGVVFTNLWIIVGVKYCFRYNARARQMRLAAEEGDQINMENMPHPRRRRREKKLMTIDEVNEKFPMMKYKTWVASRALNGLPTRGGVDMPSRPSSVRSAAGVIASVVEPQPPTTPTTIATADVDSTPKQSKTTDTTKTAESAPAAAGNSTKPDSTTAAAAANRVSVVSAEGDAQDPSFYSKDRNSDEHEHQSEDEEDEHINSALPPECVGTSGDTCAICIDTLEDDDDVRGLTCGHAFHAVCLDPWLTSRRACCPLCKADYYTPKPRAPAAEGAGDAATQQGPTIGVIAVNLEPATTRHRSHFMGTGISSWAGIRGPGSYLPTRFMMGSRSAAYNQPDAVSAASAAAAAPASGRASESQAQPEQLQPTASRSNWVSNLRPFRRRQDQATPEVSQPAPVATPAGAAANAEVTPSQLEAGVRN